MRRKRRKRICEHAAAEGGGGVKRRTGEACKTAAIVLLLLSVVLLTLTAAYYSGSMDGAVGTWIGGASSQPPKLAQEPALTDAAQPVCISVLGSTGRASFWGDFTVLDSVYEALGSHLAAALDTASSPVEITAAAFYRAASRPGVCFWFPGDLALGVLGAWLDATAEVSLSAGQFFLGMEDGAVSLLVRGADGFWKMETQADPAAFQEVLDDYPADGTSLAGELDRDPYRHLDPMALVVADVWDVAAAGSENPCDEAFLTEAAALLGFNPYGDSNYRDDLGNTVYTETDCSLRIGADGVLALQNQGLAPRFSAASADLEDQIEYVRSLTQTLAGSRMGDARLLYTGSEQHGALRTVRFEYFLSGLLVGQRYETAVTAQFSGAVLSELTFRVRTYTLRETERLQVLPAEQAAAILPQGAVLQLAYADAGESRLQAGWLP